MWSSFPNPKLLQLSLIELLRGAAAGMCGDRRQRDDDSEAHATRGELRHGSEA